ncbi:hypothetical protein GCM10025858_11620 [Alicyclobacillus sacchari]|nr:hypothetical protein GCM10025858_11620 [Alicyclobacillus sacchari]
MIVEIHPTPDQAMSDAAQTIDYQEFGLMVEEVNLIADVLHGTRKKAFVGV